MLSSEFYKYTASEEFQELLKSYEKSREEGAPNYLEAEDLVDIAEYYHINNDLAKSEDAATYCLQVFPDCNAASLFLSRMELMDYGDIKRAKMYFDAVKDKVDTIDSVEALYIEAEIMICEGEKLKANTKLYDHYAAKRRSYAHLFNEKGELVDTRNNLLERADSDEEEDQLAMFLNFPLDVAMLFCDHEEYELSEIWLGSAKYMQGTFEYEETWARIYSYTSRFPQAVTAWNKVLDIDAFNVNSWMGLWNVQFNSNLYEDSLQSVEYALAIQPDMTEAQAAKANSLYKLQRYQETIDALAELHKTVKDDPLSELLFALSYMHLNKLTEAEAHAENVMKLVETLSFEDKLQVLKFASDYMSEFNSLYQRLNPDDDQPTPLE